MPRYSCCSSYNHSNIQMNAKCVHPSTEALANALQSSYNHWYNLTLFQRPKPFQLSLSLSLQILLFFNLFGFFLMYSTIIWYSNINDGAWFCLFVHQIKLGLLASITLSHWIFISQINLTSSSSVALSGQCHLYHFSFLSRLCFLCNFQWTNFATVSCLCHAFSSYT